MLRRPPADGYVVAGLVLLAQIVPLLSPGGVLRVAVALPLVLFLPGYTLTWIVFPRASDARVDARTERQRSEDGHLRVGFVERIALSFGLSVGISSLVAFGLTQLVRGFTLGPALGAVSAVVLVFAVVGIARRLNLPPNERYTVPFRRWMVDARRTVRHLPRPAAVVAVALAVAVVATLGGVGYAVTQPLDRSTYTSFQLVQPNGSGGYVAADYPSELEDDEAASVVVAVRNEEDRTVAYTVVVVFQRLGADGEAERRSVLERYDKRVADGETWHRPVAVEPPRAGEESRLVYLLYRGSPPETPTIENSYRHLYVWLDVDRTGSNGDAEGGPGTGP